MGGLWLANWTLHLHLAFTSCYSYWTQVRFWSQLEAAAALHWVGTSKLNAASPVDKAQWRDSLQCSFALESSEPQTQTEADATRWPLLSPCLIAVLHPELTSSAQPQSQPRLLPLRLCLVPQAKHHCMQTGYEPKLLVALETKLLQKNTQLCPEAGRSQKPEVTADQITN